MMTRRNTVIDRRFLHETLYDNLDSIVNKRITILGCGAIGANLTISLGRRGFRNFFLVDDDKIDEHNFSTQPWYVQDLHRLKAKTLSRDLASFNFKAAGVTNSTRITAKENCIPICEGSDLVIDCFDNSESRRYAQEAYEITKKAVLHVGMSNENTGEVRWADNYKVPPDIGLDDPCNYPLSRTLIELTVTASSEAVIKYLKNGIKYNYFINANTLKIVVT